MSDNRPDPDALLSRLANESGNSQRGRLKVFFGANAGVGKTYAMLEAAQALLREGNQPLVGIVETHGRTDTAALLKGLEILPRRTYEHRGITLQEFDLDAALDRKPKLLLLDELAHSNAPGSRHEKRWQDVDELLTAGIDVYTTLNVQHLESLNDVVEQITGVKVRETVPDHLLEQADEIILLDLPAQELLQRLKEGKVYTGAQANRAVENFFKTGNLLALRELALRFVAKRVNVAVQVYRDAESVRKTWATQERLLVAVGPSPSSAKLVRATKRLATNLGAEWIAASVTTPQSHSSPSARERVAENQRLAQSLGAEVVSISGNSVAQAILDYARNRNVTKIIAGKPIHSRWHELLRPSPVDRLIRESGDIDIYIIRGEGDSDPPRRSRTTYPTTAKPYYAAFTFIAASSVVALLIYPYFTLPDLVMIYLLGITTTALYGSWGATLFATFLGVMAFNILFVPPRFTMSVESPQYLLTFTMMSIVALVISSLTLRLRRQFTLSRENEQRTVILHRLSRRLAALRGLDSILQATLEEVAEAFHTEVIAFIPGEEGRATFFSGHPVSIPPGEKETAVAQWVLSNSRPAGSGTGTLESSLLTHLPIRVAEGEPLAVLALMPSKKSPVLQPDQMELLSSLCAQTALALEVDRLEQRRRQAQTEVETERLRSSVLSTVSHDLRTPIASIQGSAETLLDGENRIPKETRLELLRTITEETHRMSGLIGNLLEMTRLEGGGFKLNCVPMPLEEIVGSALAALKSILKDRTIQIQMDPSLPFVFADEVLLQHVLLNLLDNALKYSPDKSAIQIIARQVSQNVELEVRDHGTGFDQGEELLIFQKFKRGTSAKSKTGVGLGLAICKAIIEAHGGAITARNNSEGGASFIISLPAQEPIQLPQEEIEA